MVRTRLLTLHDPIWKIKSEVMKAPGVPHKVTKFYTAMDDDECLLFTSKLTYV